MSRIAQDDRGRWTRPGTIGAAGHGPGRLGLLDTARDDGPELLPQVQVPGCSWGRGGKTEGHHLPNGVTSQETSNTWLACPEVTVTPPAPPREQRLLSVKP